ncbi:MAG: hypothetical protein FJ276_06715 [Planctomycetes bacterium]|nr:hypothetical protein [Planctomycetota bacterium]
MVAQPLVHVRARVEITAAVDIFVKKDDAESQRTPNAAKAGGDSYDRIDLTGEIKLHNYHDKPVKMEVVRYVLGNVDEAGADGTFKTINAREEGPQLLDGYPYWWHWYNWPYGWYHLNGIGRITWQFELPSGKGVTLPCKWHHFWQR